VFSAFLLASLIGIVLVAGRAVQGLGAGVVPAVAYVAISRCYAEESRPKMFAVLG
jgi:MFS family permease